MAAKIKEGMTGGQVADIIEQNFEDLENRFQLLSDLFDHTKEDINRTLDEYQELVDNAYGSLVTQVDEEDTTTDKGKIKFKDRAYEPEKFSGKGYKILRKNIVCNIETGESKNILTQDMINEPNTVYEIRYDFDLNGATLNLPNNCYLHFEDEGKIINGTITGKVLNEYLIPDWFTLDINDSTEALQNINNICNTIKLLNRDYKSHNITFNGDLNLIGVGSYARLMPLDTEGTFITLKCRHLEIKDIWFYGQGMDIGNLNCIEVLRTDWIEGTVRYFKDIKIYKFSGLGIKVPSRDTSTGQVLRGDVRLRRVKITEIGQGIEYNGNDTSCDNVTVGYANGYGIKIGGACNTFTDLRSWGTGRSGTGYGIEITENGNMTSIVNGRLQENFSGCIKLENSFNNYINITEDDSYSLYIGSGDYPNIELIKLDNANYNVFNITTSMYTFHNYDKTTYIDGSNNSHFNSFTIYTYPRKEEYFIEQQNVFVPFKNINKTTNYIKINDILYSNRILLDFSKINVLSESNQGKIDIKNNLIIYHLNPDDNTSIQVPISFFKGNYNTFKDAMDEDLALYCVLKCPMALNTKCIIQINVSDFTELVLQKISTITLKSGDNYVAVVLHKEEFNSLNLGEKNIQISFNIIISQPVVSNVVDVILDKCYIGLPNTLEHQFKKFNSLINLIDLNYSNDFPNYNFSSLFDLKTYLSIDSKNRLVIHIGDSRYTSTVYPSIFAISGSTESRPVNTEKDKIPTGFSYFDTNLNQYIYWDGTSWIDAEGNDPDNIPTKSGTFANKPTDVPLGFTYFCTDKKTTEGSTNGIMIYYKGNNVWVDALGREIS